MLASLSNLNSVSSTSVGITRAMINIMTSRNDGFQVCHINAQSLRKKIDEFRDLFEGSKYDAICVSETWFSSNTRNSLVHLKGFKLLRNDRLGRIGGGVAIYIRDSFNFKIKYESPPECSIEYLCIEIANVNEHLLLGVVYRPNRYIDLSPLRILFEENSFCFTSIILCGDFNSDLLTDNSLILSLGTFNIHAVNTSYPTHFSQNSSTLLDVFFVSDLSKVLLFDQLQAPGFSKHDLIHLSFDFYLNRSMRTFQLRDFKNINRQTLELDLRRIDWERVYLFQLPDEQVEFLQSNLSGLFDTHVPLKTISVKYGECPWFNSEIRLKLYQRNLAFKKWKRFRIPEDLQEYRRLRNITVRLIRTSKVIWYQSRLSLSLNGRKLWKNLKEIVNKRVNVDSRDVNCNEINWNLISSIPQPHNLPQNLSGEEFAALYTGAAFGFSGVSPDEVVESFITLKSNATGFDNLHPIFLKAILPVILPYITHIYNTILTKSIFPSQWKHAKIIPIPKNSANAEFRPISILPFLSKVLEKLMQKQLTTFLTQNSLLALKQSGFRSGHSSTTALLDVIERARNALDENKVTFLILLDYSKAFDTIDHNFMCLKLLKMYNFSPESVKLIFSYLTGRRQAVVVGDQVSDFLPLSCGVPQGSILGPIFFSIYVNEAPKLIRHCDEHLFADDLQLMKSCPVGMVEDCVTKINEDLSSINRWSMKCGLTLNPQKTKCLIISKRVIDVSGFPAIVLRNTQVDFVDTAKNLGICFNRTLKWNDHVTQAVGKAYGALRLLWPTRNFTPLDTRKMLAKTLVVPILTYGCEIFCKLDSVSQRKLNVAFNSVARYIYGLSRYDHISFFSKSIYGISFDNLLKLRTLIMFFNIVQTRQPSYLYHRIQFSFSRRSNQIIIPRFSCLTSERQFFVNASRLWNSLPRHIRNTDNLISFKRNVFVHFTML